MSKQVIVVTTTLSTDAMMDDGPLWQVLKDHNNEVTTCDISACNALATGSSDKTVRVWEWQVGVGFVPASFSPLPPHKYGVTSVRFSPQGTMLLTSSVDGTSALWNARTGSRVRTLVQATRCSVRRCEFTPDSSQVVTAGDDGVFCFWDVLHGTLIRTQRLHEEDDACLLGLAISPDSELLLSGDTGGLIKLWRLSTAAHLECLSFTKNVNDGVACCAFSPKRSLEASEELRVVYTVVTSGCDGRVLLWEVSTIRSSNKLSQEADIEVCDMMVVTVLEGHVSDVHDVRFNSMGTLLCSTGLDKLVNVWQVEDGSRMLSLAGHTRYGNCCAFNKDSTILLSGSNDRTAIVWDISGQLNLHSDLAPQCSVSSHFSTELAPESAEALLACRVEAEDNCLKLLQVLHCTATVNSCCFGPGDVLAVAGGDKIVHIWKRQGDEFVLNSSIENNSYAITNVDISQCGSRLISCAMDGLLIHCNLQMGITNELRNPAVANGLRTCCFSPAGDIIAAGGDDETVFLWDVASLEFSRTANQHRDAVTGLAFSHDSRLLASCCCAGDIMLFDIESGTTAFTEDNAHDLGAASLSFTSTDFFLSDDNAEEGDHILASCGNDSLIKIWRVSTTRISFHSKLVGHGGNVAQVRFSLKLPYIVVSAATDNTARIWNVKTGDCLYVVEHHETFVNSCCLSRDNSFLVTGSLDKTVAIWKVPESLLVGSGVGMYEMQFHKRVQQWTGNDIAKWFADFDYPKAACQAESAGLTGGQLLSVPEDVLLDRLELEGEERQSVGQLLWWIKQEATNPVSYALVQDREVPHQFLCPITHDVMIDPVLCSDGFTYERAAIMEWLVGGRSTSPMTNETLSGASIRPNPAIKLALYEFLYGIKSDE